MKRNEAQKLAESTCQRVVADRHTNVYANCSQRGALNPRRDSDNADGSGNYYGWQRVSVGVEGLPGESFAAARQLDCLIKSVRM